MASSGQGDESLATFRETSREDARLWSEVALRLSREAFEAEKRELMESLLEECPNKEVQPTLAPERRELGSAVEIEAGPVRGP